MQIYFGIEKFRTLDLTTKEGGKGLINGFTNSIDLFDASQAIIFNFKNGNRR